MSSRDLPVRLHVLGGGTPTPTPTRFGSSFVLQAGDEHLMFDCGPAATFKLVQAGLWPTQIDHLFFTHHHFDHDVDYPCFLLCRWDQGAGQENMLNVYGPTLTEALTEGLLNEHTGVFAHDWKARISKEVSLQIYQRRGGVLPRRPPAVNVRDYGPGTIRTSERWEVTAAEAVHAQPWLDSLAYRFETTTGKSVVFTGDTEPCKAVVDLSHRADALICMCWDDRESMAAVGEGTGQCSLEDAAEMAAEAGVKKLVLVHMGPHISQEGPLEKALSRIRDIYGGEVVVSEELRSIEL